MLKELSVEIPLRYTARGSSFGFRLELLCPICHENFNDISTPRLEHGNDNYEAWMGRGDCAVVPMSCEYGHEWELCVGFHKGESFLFARKEDDR
jgi:hypothetical protein